MQLFAVHVMVTDVSDAAVVAPVLGGIAMYVLSKSLRYDKLLDGFGVVFGHEIVALSAGS